MNKQIILLFLLITIFASCNKDSAKHDNKNDTKVVKTDSGSVLNTKNKYFTDSILLDDNNVPLNKTQNYFPLEIFTDTSVYVGYDTFTVTWYSRHLRAMKEPLLFNKELNKELNKEVYRFLWLRTFHNPITVRIEKSAEDYKLYWKLSDGTGGYGPGELIVNKMKKLTKREWDNFQKLLDSAKYWEPETNEKELSGFDGAQWILEGVDSKRYNVVDRWSPESGKFRECCDYLIKLTDLKINKDDIY